MILRRWQAEIGREQLHHDHGVAGQSRADAGAVIVREGEILFVAWAFQPGVEEALRKRVGIDTCLRGVMLGRDIHAQKALKFGILAHDQRGGCGAVRRCVGEIAFCRHVTGPLARHIHQNGVEHQGLGFGIECLAFLLHQRHDPEFERPHLGLGIGDRRGLRCLALQNGMAAARRRKCSDHRDGTGAHQPPAPPLAKGGRIGPPGQTGFPDQGRISNSPAAPMPPPMHIVTTPSLAPRRRPSSNRWPVIRAPLMP